ncbi:MAG: hypothetical protein MJ248_04850 [Bacilli bacterium]|nr:hypothetical protein [Bacilli bacterium]
MKKRLFGIAALACAAFAATAALHQTVVAAKAEEASLWAVDQAAGAVVTNIENGIRISNGINGVYKRVYRTEKVHVDGLEFDYHMEGLPKGYTGGYQTCLGFYFHGGEANDWFSETQSASFAWWASAQWSAQLRMFTSGGAGLNGDGGNEAYKLPDTSSSAGWSGNTCLICQTVESGTYDIHVKFEAEGTSWTKVTMSLPTSTVTSPYNKSGSNVFAYVQNSSFDLDASGNSYMSVFGYAEYPVGENQFPHAIEFTNYAIDHEKEATAWANAFMSGTDASCALAESERQASLASKWADLKAQYDALSTSAKNVVKVASSNEAGTTLEQAMARYTQLVQKYALEDFAGVVTSSNSNFSLMNRNNVTISFVAIAAILTVGGVSFVTIRKKKESK